MRTGRDQTDIALAHNSAADRPSGGIHRVCHQTWRQTPEPGRGRSRNSRERVAVAAVWHVWQFSDCTVGVGQSPVCLLGSALRHLASTVALCLAGTSSRTSIERLEQHAEKSRNHMALT